ncbi:carbohydrate binding family 9 domain-containing protein [Antarcticibacterium flavum]|uniref:Carbohydrate binding family 9 domain-containing protein n=1 Tax=Antarcticibacterium flavum TaxID=2058175 RepID=A0A5B7X773_9FLAO|nr:MULTISPECIES: DUF5916 domain-containing protein [Antarcticibacterium]MCM4160334.1 hydrolase [Antarcticibacterium sp. W02-3]QCY71287.1 carbohydrate binding family 9 domain-containing protein [Antarcticibacterium flavum]
MSSKSLLALLLLLVSFNIQSQEENLSRTTSPKKYEATRIKGAPQIDGRLDDQIWQDIPVTGNFVQIEPGDGNPERETHKTFVKIAYDDEAIYIAASMRDVAPQTIFRQFTQRDNLGQSDFFLIDINTYNDGENQTRFIVTSAGAIADARMTGENEDYNYNVVWDAAATIDEDGWNAEIKIPYAALRFPKKEEQLWGIQMGRQISYLNENYVWNYVNKAVGKASQYTGHLTGIKNITPPVRLSFYPYTSAEVDHFNANTLTNFNAGMDFKYGISDAFTLDATLIPDFGQTAFDNVELNLTPFEQEFGENRAFFTEGTELFTKGNLFYSRRIGDSPIGFNAAQRERLNNEVILENPEEAALINALKISGRTNNDLGIGFFNAITREEKAVYLDTVTRETRQRVTEPFANYNIVVLDQQFNQNSSLTLINTNVTREGHFRDGNVSAFLFDVFNRSNSFNFTGEAKMSNVNHPHQNITGFASSLGVNRTKGKIRYGVSHDFANETYDINDLGLNFTNNYNDFYWNTSYQIFEPSGIFNRYSIRLYGNHLRRYKPDITTGTGVGGSFFAITRNRFAFGGFTEVNSEFKDFFEPRREGTFVRYQPNISGDVWISSDYRKRFALDMRVGFQDFIDSPRDQFNLRISPRFRISDRFNMVYGFRYNNSINRPSFVSLLPRQIIFGNRNMESIENSIEASYNFNTKQGINLRFRNFWSAAVFEEDTYTLLQEDGNLSPTSILPRQDPNANFNIWNFDLSYRWQFAPGSEAILLYRNSLFNLDDQSRLGFTESLENLLGEPLRQNLSLRIVYYLDYNNVRNIFKS